MKMVCEESGSFGTFSAPSQPAVSGLRSRRVRRRAAVLFGVFSGAVIALCALLFIVTQEGQQQQDFVELTELPDGKAYMMGILRDRVRALHGKGEGRFDGVVNKDEDNVVAKLYGGYDNEAPIASSLSASFRNAINVGAMNAPALNAPVSAPHAAGLDESDGSPVLFQTGAESLEEEPMEQELQQMPANVAPAVAPQQFAPQPAYPAQPPYAPQPGYAPPPQQAAYGAAPQYPAAPTYAQPAPAVPYPAPIVQQQQPLGPYMAPSPPPPPAQEDEDDDGGLLAPSFVSPPTPSLPVQIGCEGVSFPVKALGLHSGDSVTISLVAGAPLGAILTQVTTALNPGSAVLNWTPIRSEYNQLEYQICFLATDSHHLTRRKCVAVVLNPQCSMTAPFQPVYPQGAVVPPEQRAAAAAIPPQPPAQQPYQAPYQQPYGEPPAGQAPAYGQPPVAQAPYGQQQPAAPYAPPYGAPPQQGAYAPEEPPQGQPEQQPEENTANLPAPHADCAPLFMYVNKDLNDHFYTTNFKELYGGKLHYKFEGVMTGVYAVEHQGTIPVYRYFNDKTLNHVYTLNYNEWGKGDDIKTPEGERGYTYEGAAFYIYTSPREGLRPVYMWLDKKKDTMFSLNPHEAGPDAKGFKLAGKIGYAGCSPK